MDTAINMHYVLNSLVFSGIGIAVLVAGYFLLDVLTPKVHIWTELCEKKNVALSIFLSAFVIGVSIIISSAIRG